MRSVFRIPGRGSDKEFLPYVFDRFRQADSTTTRQHGGLGLGLAIARHLVEIHGGTIRAESQGEGQGAKFTIRLPLVEPTSGRAIISRERAITSMRAPQLLSGLNVLLVDDDSDTLTLMATALTRRQANVTAVSSAGEAIRAITQKPTDVLISDIAMPDEDGYGLIEKIRSLENGGRKHSGRCDHGVCERRRSRTRAVVGFSDLSGKAGGVDRVDFCRCARGAAGFLRF